MKGKMAVVGDGDSIFTFSAVGVDAYPVNKNSEAESVIKKLAKDYAIIFITENIAKENEKIIKQYLTVPYPIILPLPSNNSNGGYGMKIITEAMEKALGINVFVGEDAKQQSKSKDEEE